MVAGYTNLWPPNHLYTSRPHLPLYFLFFMLALTGAAHQSAPRRGQTQPGHEVLNKKKERNKRLSSGRRFKMEQQRLIKREKIVTDHMSPALRWMPAPAVVVVWTLRNAHSTLNSLHSVMPTRTPCCRGRKSQRVRPISKATKFTTQSPLYLSSELPPIRLTIMVTIWTPKEPQPT